MLAITAVTVVRLHSLFAIIMLFGIFSLLSASVFVALDAVDVAFTEAAVGAGISTILMLSTLAITRQRKQRSKHNPLLPLLVVTVTGAMLVWGTWDMPPFGSPDDPIHQHVAPRFIEESPKEVGLPNMVTSVLASYRGYDTMGEVTVVFTALVGVLALLGVGRKYLFTPPHDTGCKPPRPILQVAVKPLIPFVLLFALYVQFHGDFGPGGGFQAGVIFAAGIILYALAFGMESAHALTPPWLLRPLAALGVLIYGGVGVVALLKGGKFLDYSVLAHDPVHGQHLGVLIIEFGVGLTVAAVMMLVFFAFAGRGNASNHPQEDNQT